MKNWMTIRDVTRHFSNSRDRGGRDNLVGRTKSYRTNNKEVQP